MPDAQLTIPTIMSPSAEPEITVIPDAYYGAALTARVPESQPSRESAAGLVQPAPRSGVLPVVLGVVLLLFVAGGVFVYVNRGLFFPTKPAAQPVAEVPKPPPTPPPQAPTAPENLVVTSTNPQSALVSWVDTASNESGYRVERATAGAPFQAVTNLPPNSTSFQDASVSPGQAYRYRIFAYNQTGDSPASAEAEANVSALPPPPPEQPKLPPAGLDSDSDGLSDLEETLFHTEAKNPDTDGDGFLDGNELYNLYNPNGKAPAKLAESDLAKTVSGSIGWTLFIPATWTFTLNANDGSQATIATGHGESFKLAVLDNPNDLPILDWYLAKYPAVKATDVLQYRSKHGYKGIIGADLLTTYIPWGSKVLTFTYDLDGQSFINYRTTYYMILNSLILEGVPLITVPAGSGSLPFEPAATTPGVVTAPVAVIPTSTTEVTSTAPVEPVVSPVSSAPEVATSTP